MMQLISAGCSEEMRDGSACFHFTSVSVVCVV